MNVFFKIPGICGKTSTLMALCGNSGWLHMAVKKKTTATHMYSNRKLNKAAHFIKENSIFIYFFPSENSSSLTMGESVPAPSFFSKTHLAVLFSCSLWPGRLLDWDSCANSSLSEEHSLPPCYQISSRLSPNATDVMHSLKSVFLLRCAAGKCSLMKVS